MEKKSRLFTLMITVLLLSLVGSLLVITPVRAQDPETTLSIASSVDDLCENAELTLTVHVADVVNLYGYDISLNFDPDTIEVLSMTINTWFTNAVRVSSTINNSTGFIRYAATKTAGSGNTGSGDLLNIRIRVKAPAETIQFFFVTTGTYATKLVNSSVAPIPYVIGDTGNIITHSCQLHFPDSSRITCEATTIPVRVEDIYGLYGYDLHISYNPAYIDILDVSFDDSFIEITNFPYIDFSTPGSIWVFGTKTNPAPPSTGSGVLINISAYPSVPNQNSGLAIELTSEFSDQNGFLIPVNIENHPIWTYPCDPNAVDVMSFDVVRKKVKAILTWETANELDNVGFNIYRSGFADGTMKKMNKELIPAQAVGSTTGALYEYINKPLKPWKTYYFWLESVDVNGETALYGPIKAPKLMR